MLEQAKQHRTSIMNSYFIHRSQTFNVIIDLESMTLLLIRAISNFLGEVYSLEEITELANEVKTSLIVATICFINQNKDKANNYNEAQHQAIDRLSYHEIPLELAAEIVHEAEMNMLSSITSYFPDIDDTAKLNILSYKLLSDGSVCFIMEHKQ